MNNKVAVIGTGYVGSCIAYTLLIRSMAQEVVLIDKDKYKCNAEVKDIRHGVPNMGSSRVYAGDYKDIKGCSLIIITAGRNRRIGETRMDLATDNLDMARLISNEITKHYDGGVILIITNPVDVVTLMMTKWLALPKGRVFGTGCSLDSSRFNCIIADHVGAAPDAVNAFVIGQHGEGQVPFWSKVLVDGKPVSFDSETQKEIETQITEISGYIIGGKGRTHYGIAACVGYLANAILNDRGITVSVSSVLTGEYGICDIALSLPSIVSAKGIKRVLTEPLSEEEYTQLKKVAARLQEQIIPLCPPSLSVCQ